MAGALLCVLVGCSSTGASSDAAGTGMCGADTPAGQACSALMASGAPVTPTCVSGTLPTGQGGTIVDGTYVLTALTYYSLSMSICPTVGLSETVALAGGCLEFAAGAPFSVTTSGTYSVSGVTFMSNESCVHFDRDGGTFTRVTIAQTYTATATTLTVFTRNPSDGGATGDDYVAVFTKQ